MLSPALRLDGCLAAGGVETHLESSTGTGHWRSDWEMPAAISPHTCSLFPLRFPLSLSLFISQSAGYKSSGYQVQCPCWHFHELTHLCLWCWVPCHSPWASDAVTDSECDWAYWRSPCIYYVAPYMIIFSSGLTVLEMSTRLSDLLELLLTWLKLADRSNASDAYVHRKTIKKKNCSNTHEKPLIVVLELHLRALRRALPVFYLLHML